MRAAEYPESKDNHRHTTPHMKRLHIELLATKIHSSSLPKILKMVFPLKPVYLKNGLEKRPCIHRWFILPVLISLLKGPIYVCQQVATVHNKVS